MTQDYSMMNFPSTASIYPSTSDDQSTDLEPLFPCSYPPPFFVGDEEDWPSLPRWTWSEDRQFEIALVMFPDDTPDRWERIAGQIPGKSVAQVFQHYEDLVQDVTQIDAGGCDWLLGGDEDDGGQVMTCLGSGKEQRETASERRRGSPWTEEEHRRFLEGLEKYGKGDWRSISRNAVISRTPTQVASHAQKYFLRLHSVKNKKRPSIHDVRPGDNWADVPGMDVEEAQ
ncbi:unnamed protein product [Linum tenue]|uniref:Uncharacterized protein n=1 Tax=Linum tenue TaxID=586396 RepID=A0AAV0QIY9_9ROSI|nr:unnamed protein product [Linum tenue]